MMLKATFSNISAISWRPVWVVEEAGENHRPWASNWKILSLVAVNRVHPFCNLQSRYLQLFFFTAIVKIGLSEGGKHMILHVSNEYLMILHIRFMILIILNAIMWRHTSSLFSGIIASMLILTISRSEIKWKMSYLPININSIGLPFPSH
jgi:hypothetical protein